jgi:hypothetical protein
MTQFRKVESSTFRAEVGGPTKGVRVLFSLRACVKEHIRNMNKIVSCTQCVALDSDNLKIVFATAIGANCCDKVFNAEQPLLDSFHLFL